MKFKQQSTYFILQPKYND